MARALRVSVADCEAALPELLVFGVEYTVEGWLVAPNFAWHPQMLLPA